MPKADNTPTEVSVKHIILYDTNIQSEVTVSARTIRTNCTVADFRPDLGANETTISDHTYGASNPRQAIRFKSYTWPSPAQVEREHEVRMERAGKPLPAPR